MLLIRLASREKGFTLVEMLVVLSIVALCCTIPAALFVKRLGDVKLEQFLEQLEGDIYYIQQLSMSSQSVTTITFDTNKHVYKITGRRQYRPLEQKAYPKEIRVLAGTLPSAEIKFLSTGNISQVGTMEFWYGKRKVKMTFQMGKGRFYVHE
ncbi:MAG: competence type IV pilus minor pilin ComGD [Bacillaceae bacterium]